ncbi:MAG: hypothetical protein ACQESG_05445 [Nanobdellota archaeon]
MDAAIMDPGVAGGLANALAGAAIFVALIVIPVYIYMALTMMKTAQRLGTPNAWLAWIPIGNLVLMANMARMHWWPVLLLIGAVIPFLNLILAPLAGLALAVFGVIWLWKICEARNKPGWFAVITVVPIIGGIWGLVLWGILAWGQ